MLISSHLLLSSTKKQIFKQVNSRMLYSFTEATKCHSKTGTCMKMLKECIEWINQNCAFATEDIKNLCFKGVEINWAENKQKKRHIRLCSLQTHVVFNKLNNSNKQSEKRLLRKSKGTRRYEIREIRMISLKSGFVHQLLLISPGHPLMNLLFCLHNIIEL